LQATEHLFHEEFQKYVDRYGGGDRYAKRLSCWEELLGMAFAQLSYHESLCENLRLAEFVGLPGEP
jgi:hypothetical protein